MTHTRIAAFMVTVVLALSLSACGRSAGPSAGGHVGAPTATTEAPRSPAAEPELTEPGSVARDYALAARVWSADTYRAQYRRQLELSTGPLRSALQRVPPTDGQIAQYQADEASLRAHVESVSTRHRSATAAQVTVVLSEVSTAAGQTTTQCTVNLVDLQRRDTKWRVSGFTVLP